MWMRTVLAVTAAWVAMAGGAAAAPDPAQVDYGRYLVEGVGLCDDCHTPRDGMGRPDGGRRLQGSPILFQPTVAIPDWADSAPPLAGGRQGWTRQQLVEFLVSGSSPAGRHARPPMPPYRLKPQDAEAVAAYLESLR